MSNYSLQYILQDIFLFHFTFKIYLILYILYFTVGRWLVAALQMVSRSWVNAFPIENEENWFVGNRKNKNLQLALENSENTDNENNSKNDNENIVVSNVNNMMVKKNVNKR